MGAEWRDHQCWRGSGAPQHPPDFLLNGTDIQGTWRLLIFGTAFWVITCLGGSETEKPSEVLYNGALISMAVQMSYQRVACAQLGKPYSPSLQSASQSSH